MARWEVNSAGAQAHGETREAAPLEEASRHSRTWGICICRPPDKIMNHASLLVRSLTRTGPLPLRAIARHHNTHWPRIASQTCYRGRLQRFHSTIRTMASIHIDDKVKALINNSYPQTQDAGDDPHKLSSIAYPHVEVRT